MHNFIKQFKKCFRKRSRCYQWENYVKERKRALNNILPPQRAVVVPLTQFFFIPVGHEQTTFFCVTVLQPFLSV